MASTTSDTQWWEVPAGIVMIIALFAAGFWFGHSVFAPKRYRQNDPILFMTIQEAQKLFGIRLVATDAERCAVYQENMRQNHGTGESSRPAK